MTLTVSEPPNRREALRRALRGELLQWQSRQVMGCRYISVVWCGSRERIPWGRIAAITDRPRTPLLLPPGMLPPPGCPVRCKEPQEYPARLAVQAAAQCLSAAPHLRSGTVGIIDPQGIAPWACSALSALCRGVKVYTLRRSRYAAEEQFLWEENGLPLQWADTPADLAGCVLCVAPYPTGVLAIPAPVITADRSGIQGRPTVNRLQPVLTDEQKAAVPLGVDAAAFWGMVTEYGPRRAEAPMTVQCCRIDGRLAQFDELPRLLKT